jgi:hypothetical protein
VIASLTGVFEESMMQITNSLFGTYPLFAYILLATLSPNGVDVWQEAGAVMFLGLLTTWIAENLTDNGISQTTALFSLFIIDAIILGFLGYNKPFHGVFGIGLLWLALIVPLCCWAMLTAVYLRDTYKAPLWKTLLFLTPVSALTIYLYWLYVRV